MPESNAEAPVQPPAEPAAPVSGGDEVLTEDLLVEEVSIDGMCGVY
jgi:mycofactocin precursor